MEIRLLFNFYWVLSKRIRKFFPGKLYSIFAILLLSFSHTALVAQISQPTSGANPACLGSPVTFSTTVSGTSTDNIVTFYDNGVSMGTNTITGGVATFTTAALTAGTHLISASYIDASTGLTTSTDTLPVITALSTISYTGSPYCAGAGTATVTLTGTGGGTSSSTTGRLSHQCGLRRY